MKYIIGIEGGCGGVVNVGAAAIGDTQRNVVKNAVSGSECSRSRFDMLAHHGHAITFDHAIPVDERDLDDDQVPPFYVAVINEPFAQSMRVEQGPSLWALLESSQFRQTILPTLIKGPVETQVGDTVHAIVFPSLNVFQDYMTGVISRFLSVVGYGPLDHPSDRAMYLTLKSLHMRCILWGELVGSRFWGNPYYQKDVV